MTLGLVKQKTDDPYLVSFSDIEVICTCPDFKGQIEGHSKNEVCKHICIVINKSEGTIRQKYKGQRYYTRQEKDEIFDILDIFNPRTLIEKPPGKTKVNKKVEKTKKNKKNTGFISSKIKTNF